MTTSWSRHAIKLMCAECRAIAHTAILYAPFVYLVYYTLSILADFSKAACRFRMNGTVAHSDAPTTKMMPSILKIGP